MTIAVSFNWGNVAGSVARYPPPYGHIWTHAHQFWLEVVEPRLQRLRSSEPLPWATVVLPRGFEELAAIWSSNATRLSVSTQPWVPLCFATKAPAKSPYCCWSSGKPPAGAQIALLAGFPSRVTPFEWARFRQAAWRSLGFEFDGLPSITPSTQPCLVWVRSLGSNGRRIESEGLLARRVRARLATLYPSWSFKELTPHMAYADELRMVAGATVLVSLFGSALHNVRFMANGSLVIEIHAALRNDFGHQADYLYRDLCASVGVRWVGYAPRGFRPPPHAASAAEHDAYGFTVARVNAADFVRFVERALQGEASRAQLIAEYDQRVRAHSDPRTIRDDASHNVPKVRSLMQHKQLGKAPRLTLLLRCSSAEYLPLVLPAFACVDVSVVFQFDSVREHARCTNLCGAETSGGGGLGCTCVMHLDVVKEMQHVAIARHATGESDLLYAHADMWVNLPRIMALLHPERAFTPRRGLQHRPGGGQPMCVDVARIGECTPVQQPQGNAHQSPGCALECGRDRWAWWSNSLHKCRLAAGTHGFRWCCYAWSDLLFLPAAAQPAFRRLASSAFASVFHEVAIPTILQELTRRATTSGASSGVRWSPSLDCLGGCCTNVHWNRTVARSFCAHRVSLHHHPKLSCDAGAGAMGAGVLFASLDEEGGERVPGVAYESSARARAPDDVDDPGRPPRASLLRGTYTPNPRAPMSHRVNVSTWTCNN